MQNENIITLSNSHQTKTIDLIHPERWYGYYLSSLSIQRAQGTKKMNKNLLFMIEYAIEDNTNIIFGNYLCYKWA